MFSRRRKTLSDTIRDATDPNLRSLRAELSKRQEKVAELELELFDLRVSLEEFERELEARVRPLERQLAELQAELDRARRQAERRAQWGERAESEDTPDVVEQFERTWRPRPSSSQATRKPTPLTADETELKNLYRALAKRFHPDLTTAPEEKRWREERMAEINQAYESKDLAALQRLQAQPDQPQPEARKSSEELTAEMQAEVIRLDGVIAALQRELSELASSELAKLQLAISMGRQSGQDLLAQLAHDLEKEIGQIKAELASFA
jgi:predicted  nucleic acid-binding Zn-ribbon protein